MYLRLKNRVVIVEGIDGSGKTTLVHALREALTSQDKYGEWVRFHQPGGSLVANNVRKTIKSMPIDPWVTALLMSAARVDTALEWRDLRHTYPGVGIISDRGEDSMIVYQGASGVPHTELKKLVDLTQTEFTPDLTVYLNVPVEVAMGRIKERVSAGEGAKLDPFDMRPTSFFEDCKLRYETLVKLAPPYRKYLILNGEDSVEHNVAMTIERLKQLSQ